MILLRNGGVALNVCFYPCTQLQWYFIPLCSLFLESMQSQTARPHQVAPQQILYLIRSIVR